MGKPLRSAALIICIAVLPLVGMAAAQAKQQCSATMPSDPHGQWWSYRFIDGRKCWYAGKPMLSKSLLEWPKEASAKPGSAAVGSVPVAQPGDPLDGQEVALKDPDTFEERWRARISICRTCN
jgi:hypothetical protein